MRILIIGPSWVGDSVMAQTLYKCLKKEDPSCQLDVFSPSWSMSLLSRMPEVSVSIESNFAHGDFKAVLRYRLAKEIKKNKYDRAILLTNSMKSSLIPFFADIPIRTGWLGEMRYGLVNDIRKLDKSYQYLMIEKFAALSIQPSKHNMKDLPLPKLSVDSINQKLQLDKFNINFDKPCLAICPGAEFGPSKKWPAEYYAEIALNYIDKGWNVISFGSPNDQKTAEEIIRHKDLLKSPNFHNLIGKTSLLDAIDLLSLCKIAVTNDSGLMHVAAAVETPLVALYGPSSPEYTPPLINRKVILRNVHGYDKTRTGDLKGGYHSSLLSIKPNEVMDALKKFNS